MMHGWKTCKKANKKIVVEANFEVLAIAQRPLKNDPKGVSIENLSALSQLKLTEHMSGYLCSNGELFIGFARNAWSSERDRAFYEAIFMLTWEDNVEFDKSCSIIFADLFEKLQDSCIAPRNNVSRSFDYCLFAYLASKALDDAIGTMPENMGKYRLPCTVVVRLIATKLIGYSYDLMRAFSQRRFGSMSF